MIAVYYRLDEESQLVNNIPQGDIKEIDFKCLTFLNIYVICKYVYFK